MLNADTNTFNNAPSQNASSGKVLGKGRCAALLNANAKRVNHRTQKQIDRLLPGDVYLSGSQEEGDQILGRLIDEGCEIIFAGGGDGTIIHTINALVKQLELRGMTMEEGPLVGLLPLGTGNALANHFKLGGAIDDLGWLSHGAPLKIAPLRMMKNQDGTLFPMAGTGLDGMLLNDYIALKNNVRNTPMASMFTGLPGYLTAMVRTLSRLVDPRQPSPEFKIINSGARAWQVNAVTGDVVRTIEPGECLYNGPALMASGASISCYGFGMKLFPVADRRIDRFQLRVYSGSAFKAACNIPKLFDGTFQDDGLYDFLVDDITIETDRGCDYQIAGDAMGTSHKLRWSLSDRIIPIAVPDRSLLH